MSRFGYRSTTAHDTDRTVTIRINENRIARAAVITNDISFTVRRNLLGVVPQKFLDNRLLIVGLNMQPHDMKDTSVFGSRGGITAGCFDTTVVFFQKFDFTDVAFP